MEPSEDQFITTWVQITRAHTRVLNHVESKLKKAGLSSLTWYDVLLELERADKHGLRPFELEKKLLLPQYGISRLVDRIEKAGLLARTTCNEDGRGQKLLITKNGRQLRQKMWPVYRKAIQEVIGRNLTKSDAAQLSAQLAGIGA